MSFLRRGNKRGRRGVALVAAGALMAFQALALVGAQSAFAISSCTFSGGTLSIVLESGEDIVISQNATGDILIDGDDTITHADCLTATRATVTNTTAISVTGFTGDESVTIQMDEDGAVTDLVSWGAINWTINLASGTGDLVVINLADASADDLDIALGASGIDLNNDDDLDVTLAAVEDVTVDGGAGDDTIWAAGSTATGAAFTVNLLAFGRAGDDTLASGAGDDDLRGGLEGSLGDTVDFSGATAAVNVNLTGGVATGMGSDVLSDFENIVGSAFNDSLTGDTQVNDIAPGLGDDTLNGGGPEIDYVDYFDAPAAVTVDLAANTATGGSGNDALGTSIEGAVGSDFDDSFVDQTNQDNEYYGLAGADTFSQGADPATGDADLIDGDSGVDWVDYGERTEAIQVDLDEADDSATPADTLCAEDFSGDIDDDEEDAIQEVENAMLGSGDDTFCGSAFGNSVKPGGGQNVLDGNAGSDTLDYADYEAGVEVNMAGGATAGDSAVEFENAKGSAFADNITGNELSNTLKAGKGNDNVKGGGGDDTIRAAGGNDTLRGGSGDDDMFAGAGNDRLFGGKGTDLGNGGKGKDVCKGVEIRRSCGTQKNPKAPASTVAARLV